MSEENLSLWRSVERTDPAFTKSFSGKGGFRGTAISPMYLIQKATEQWGPMGGKWGVRVLQASVVDGAAIADKNGATLCRESVYVVLAEVYHPGGAIPCFGQTTFCGQRTDGRLYTDEEAPKKALTDALTKGLSWLGFAADVHMGRYDDVKYVNQVRESIAAEKEQSEREAIRERAAAILEEGGATSDGLVMAWKSLSPKMQAAAAPEFLQAAAKHGKSGLTAAWMALSNDLKKAHKDLAATIGQEFNHAAAAN